MLIGRGKGKGDKEGVERKKKGKGGGRDFRERREVTEKINNRKQKGKVKK